MWEGAFHKSIPQDLVKKIKAAILWTRGSGISKLADEIHHLTLVLSFLFAISSNCNRLFYLNKNPNLLNKGAKSETFFRNL